MRHDDYWRGRFEQLEKAQNANGVRYVKRVQKEYDKAIKSIEKDIAYWYERFASANGVSYTEAKRLLSTKELQAFRMDVKEYIEKGESLDPQWREQLEQASVKVHVSRLESLKLQIQQEAERVSGDFADSFDDFAFNTYSEQYYKTAFEIQKGLRVGWEVMRLDRRTVDKVIRKPWTSDGRNFSERVWANRSKLVNELHTNLTQGIIRGDDPKKTIDALSKRMNVSKVAAGRLIMTEHAFFSSAANKDVYKDLEVEKYEILATLDSKTSEICRDMDGKIFKRSEYEVGITAPPFHVWCRTTTVPYFDDEEEGKRAARDKDGKYYLIPENMTYREWEKTFVDGGSKEGLEKATPEALQDAVLSIDKNSKLFKSYGENHYMAVHDLLKTNANESQRKIWAKYEPELGITNTKARKGAYFSSSDGGITINLEEDAKGSDWSAPYRTTFHELGHNIDYLAGGKKPISYYSSTYKGGIFQKTIFDEINEQIDALNKKLRNEFNSKATKEEQIEHLKEFVSSYDLYSYENGYRQIKWKKEFAYKAFEKELRSIDRSLRSSISDIVEGVTSGKVQAGFGHGKAYWKRQTDGVAKEAFAEFWECIADTEERKVLEKYLPKASKIFDEMIEDLANE